MVRGHSSDPAARLGKRERQIMDILYSLGRATVADVLEALPDPPSYSSVRAMLRYLEDKGQVRHDVDGPRYIYAPTAAKAEVRKSALGHVVKTFFDGSISSAVATLIQAGPLSQEDHERLTKLLDEAASKDSQK